MIFKSRRIKELEERVERLEAAALWFFSDDARRLIPDYKIYRLIEILGLSTAESEELLKRHLRDSVNSEG